MQDAASDEGQRRPARRCRNAPCRRGRSTPAKASTMPSDPAPMQRLLEDDGGQDGGEGHLDLHGDGGGRGIQMLHAEEDHAELEHAQRGREAEHMDELAPGQRPQEGRERDRHGDEADGHEQKRRPIAEPDLHHGEIDAPDEGHQQQPQVLAGMHMGNRSRGGLAALGSFASSSRLASSSSQRSSAAVSACFAAARRWRSRPIAGAVAAIEAGIGQRASPMSRSRHAAGRSRAAGRRARAAP